MQDTRLHFSCQIDLKPLSPEGSGNVWIHAISLVRRWLQDRMGGLSAGARSSLNGDWFVRGIELPARVKDHSILTTALSGQFSVESPEFWALRWEHKDSDYKTTRRTWRTDVAITRLIDSVQVAVRVTHTLDDWIGDEPEAPRPSVPRIVTDFVTEKGNWKAFNGDTPLFLTPILVRNNQADQLRDFLQDPNRQIPLIVVSLAADGQPAIDAKRIAKHLCGVALTLRYESFETEAFIDAALPPFFRTYGGAVRVYQPRVSFSDYKDSFRHRFFSQDVIEASGAEEVEDTIIRGVLRRSISTPRDVVATIEDVSFRKAVSIGKADQSTAEWVDALESRNSQIEKELQSFQKSERGLNQQLEDVESKLLEANKKVAALEYDKGILSETADRLRRENAILLERSAALLFSDLPTTPKEVAELAGRLFCGKLHFLPRAMKSAADAAHVNVKDMWNMLATMANVLWPLYFEGDLSLREIRDEFERTTRYELAVGESETTMSSKKLSRQFFVPYGNQEMSIETHIRLGRDPKKLIRIYYGVDKKQKLFVIGHAGRHLDTSTTN